MPLPPGTDWAMIPRNWVNFPLTARDMRIAIALFSHGPDCWPSMPTVARLAKVSVSTVQRTLRKLERLGLVRRSERYLKTGAQTSNLYEVATGSMSASSTTVTGPPGRSERELDRQTDQGTDKRTTEDFKANERARERFRELFGRSA